MSGVLRCLHNCDYHSFLVLLLHHSEYGVSLRAPAGMLGLVIVNLVRTSWVSEECLKYSYSLYTCRFEAVHMDEWSMCVCLHVSVFAWLCRIFFFHFCCQLWHTHAVVTFPVTQTHTCIFSPYTIHIYIHTSKAQFTLTPRLISALSLFTPNGKGLRPYLSKTLHPSPHLLTGFTG